MELKGFFDAPKTSERYLKLNDTKQDVPVGRCRVIGAEKRTSAAGIEYKVIIVEDEKKDRTTVLVWDRNVSHLINEWGTDPSQWGYIQFVKRNAAIVLEICKNQVDDEQTI